MQKAIEWMANNKGDSAIITDSLSMTSALEANEWKSNDFHLTTIKNSVEQIESKVVLLWIPSHCDVRGNEAADQLSKHFFFCFKKSNHFAKGLLGGEISAKVPPPPPQNISQSGA